MFLNLSNIYVTHSSAFYALHLRLVQENDESQEKTQARTLERKIVTVQPPQCLYSKRDNDTIQENAPVSQRLFYRYEDVVLMQLNC